ncbi:unnamed protein product [Orchesella dallaii]
MEELNKQLEEKDRFARELQKQLARAWERNKILSYQMSMLNTLFNETEGVTIDFEKIKAIGDIVRESQSFAEETEEEVMSDDLNSNAARRPSVDLENLLDSIESESAMPAEIPGEESCYKSVDTKRGPELVLSVSRTFIKLKDLIVEKKSLQKEIDTLKSLNTKLESKVDKQEHRLYRVTMELNKTWSLVSKLKQQHKRLYNSEAVLRYELQEKRTLLEKLKNELSSSREKWRRVRQKNSQSQIEWEKLRDEFAQRKHQSSQDQESGTFSEVMSVSSGENDVTVEEDDEATSARRRSCKLERPKSLPLPINGTSDRECITDVEEVEDGPEEEEEEEEACAMSRMDDEPLDSEDPLEDLVADLVEDIDNEADTEEEASTSRPAIEIDSSPSPDFEDRMRRRANRLRMLEEQCHVLHQRLIASTARSEVISTKLAQLHDHYGPSGSSTGTPSDEQPQTHDHGDDTSRIQDEAHAITPTEEESSTSTDAAYVSGTEKENNGCSSKDDTKPEIVPQSDSLQNETNYPEPDALLKSEELINASQNSTINVASTSTENNVPTNDAIQETQGHLCVSEELSVTVVDQVCEASNNNANDAQIIPVHGDTLPETIVSSTLLPITSSSAPTPDDVPTTSQDPESNETAPSNQSDITQSEQSHVSEEEQQQHQPNQQQHQSDTPEIQQAAEIQLEEVVPIQETAIVQHFPSTTEEEANEFAAVQIRPEFLRILQEADEATNANSLDWMPTLLTITHNVALLRLDPEIPSSQNDEQSRSVSESLRIEIPRHSPSPPPAPPPVPATRPRLEPVANNEVTTEDTSAEEGDEPMPAYAKDPSFLSRLIIKQLPKRLQLLKNENHTLQMETVEAKMRMKEIKRQLEKQQELTITLDGQIEDKNLVEFELREELEKKEKVIEELQMEIDESRDYVEELKKEKDDMEAYYKLLLEEKTDLEQRKAPLESGKTCNNCKRTFNLISRRKAHCKICGKIFCKDCAIPREPNKRSHKRPRLCTRCHLRRQRLSVLVSESKQSTEQLT